MAGVLYRLGRLCVRRAVAVVALWVFLAVAVHVVVWRVGAETSNDLSLPGTESQQATDLLASRFPPQQNGSSPFVFHAPKGRITDSANKKANGDVTEEPAAALLATTAPARKAGIQVAVGGDLGGVLSSSPTEGSEVIGLLTAMLILALTFGSLVAMGMPIATAVLGLLTALGLIGLFGAGRRRRPRRPSSAAASPGRGGRPPRRPRRSGRPRP